MYLTTETKKEIFAKHGKSDADTGSAEGQGSFAVSGRQGRVCAGPLRDRAEK